MLGGIVLLIGCAAQYCFGQYALVISSFLGKSDRPGRRTAVGLTLLVYDISITIDQEVSTIWGSRRSAGKYLYLIVSFQALPTTGTVR